MKKQTLSLVLALISLTLATADSYAVDYVVLQNFGTGKYSVDSGSSISPTQDATGLTMPAALASGDTFYSQPNMIPDQSNWSIYTTFYLKMNITGTNPNLPFTLTISDSSYNAELGTMSGYTVWDSSNGGGIAGSSGQDFYALLTPSSLSALQNVANLQMAWDGAGNINGKVLQVVALPEPSTYALLGMGALALSGYVVRRRRRA
jgi:hypothetical protein